MSEYEIWRKMFDDDMVHVLHEQTLLYARRDKGNPQFNVTSDEVMNFLGILLFSGYHSVPAARNFWSNQPDLKVPFVSNVMTRDTFDRLKTYMHLADNNNLMEGNKLAKVQPIYDVMNRNLTQFGFFHHDLSIDESMVPYYGKQSAKMFIRMKPIRFGYKLSVLAGYDGSPYSMSIYSGKTAEKPT